MANGPPSAASPEVPRRGTAYFPPAPPLPGTVPDAVRGRARGPRGIRVPARYGRTGERTRDAQPSTKPCQHETHVHTLAPHTHCVDTARHLMANSSCTVWLAAAERLLGRLTPQNALGRLTSQHALGRLTSQYALGRLTPQHAFSLHAVSLGILISIRSQVPRSQASFASPLASEGPLHSLTSPSLASSTAQHQRLSCPTHSCRTCFWASSQRPASPSFSPYASSCSPP